MKQPRAWETLKVTLFGVTSSGYNLGALKRDKARQCYVAVFLIERQHSAFGCHGVSSKRHEVFTEPVKYIRIVCDNAAGLTVHNINCVELNSGVTQVGYLI